MKTFLVNLLKALLNVKEEPRLYVDNGEVYKEVVRDGYVYLKDNRGFVKPMRDSRGFLVRK